MKHDEGTRLSLLIESVLTRDILYPKWRKVVKEYHHITTGCCYPASEALYHLWGKTNGFEPCYLGFDDAGYIPGIGHCTHWFLRHEDGRVLDPTAKQFSVPLDYSKGRFCGYLTKSPSKRAKEIIRRVKCSPLQIASQSAIAKKYKVNQSQVSRIKTGERWTHLWATTK